MKNIIKASAAVLEPPTLTAHEATGHTTMREHERAMKSAVTKAIQGDNRFMPPEAPAEAANVFKVAPCCVDVTTPDSEGTHHAIIHTHNGLVKHPFDYDHEENKATMHEGDPSSTEYKNIYATQVERHENMIRAMAETISCRAGEGGGINLATKDWVAGKSVSYIYVPGGITTINAGFRRNESITCTVEVDELTAKDLQDSFDFIAATEKQEPYADEDHESKKATLRYPSKKVQFTYGTHRGEVGVIVSGSEPTTYGADAVNGKVYASWSPEFATDADYAKAKCKKGHWTFPDGVRGSASNPARLVAVNFVTGALTNKPAFKNMPNVKAKHTPPPDATIKAGAPAGNRNAVGPHGMHPTQLHYAKTKAVHDAIKSRVDDQVSKLPRPVDNENEELDRSAWMKHFEKQGSIEEDHGLWPAKDELRKAEDSMVDAARHHMEKQTIYQTSNQKAELEKVWSKGMRHPQHRAKLVDLSFKLHHGDGVQATDTTQSTTIQAAWSDAARAAALEARKHGSYAEYSDEAHEASKRALDLSRTAQGHNQDRKAHMEAANSHKTAQWAHVFAQDESNDDALEKHHESHANFHESMAQAHRALHDQLRNAGNVNEFAQPTAMAAEVTAAQDIITAALEANKPATAEPSALDAIIARHASENDIAVAIAIRTPEVKAAFDAEAAEAARTPDERLESILARQAQGRVFEERLLASNPVAANHDALEAIAERNR